LIERFREKLCTFETLDGRQLKKVNNYRNLPRALRFFISLQNLINLHGNCAFLGFTFET